MSLTDKQEELSQQSTWDFSDLRALYINCTLKRSPELSHTEGLARVSMEIMRRQGVTVEMVRALLDVHDTTPASTSKPISGGSAARPRVKARRPRTRARRDPRTPTESATVPTRVAAPTI